MVCSHRTGRKFIGSAMAAKWKTGTIVERVISLERSEHTSSKNRVGKRMAGGIINTSFSKQESLSLGFLNELKKGG